MRLRQFLLATAVTAGSAAAVAAQDPDPEVRTGRRTWIRVEPNVRIRMDPFRFRMTPDRRLMVERALERAERTRSAGLDRARTQLERTARIRDLALDRSREALERVRNREFILRDQDFARRERLSDRMHENLRRERVTRERAMERVRERLDRLRDDHRYFSRRRSRTI